MNINRNMNQQHTRQLFPFRYGTTVLIVLAPVNAHIAKARVLL